MTDHGQEHRELEHLNKPIPFRCRLGWHKWGGWSHPGERTLAGILAGLTVKIGTFQRRHCVLCRKIEERIV